MGLHSPNSSTSSTDSQLDLSRPSPIVLNTFFSSSLRTLPPIATSEPTTSPRTVPPPLPPPIFKTLPPTPRSNGFHRLLSLKRNVVDEGQVPTTTTAQTRLNGGASAQSQPGLEDILSGTTQSPVTLPEFRAFLNHNPAGERVRDTYALDFLVAFREYRTAFFRLHPSEQSPHPRTVTESLSTLFRHPKSEEPPPSPVTFTTADLGSAPGSPVGHRPPSAFPSTLPRAQLLPTRPRPTSETSSAYGHGAATRVRTSALFQQRRKSGRRSGVSSVSLHLLLDPNTQPMRREMQYMIDFYLSGTSASYLMSIISPSVLIEALSGTKLTTHPATLAPVAQALAAHLEVDVLPSFFQEAMRNLSEATRWGRLLMAVLNLSVGCTLAVVFIYYRFIFPRWSRLALTPFFLVGIGSAMCWQTGLCFWLGLRGKREPKPYEPVMEKGSDLESGGPKPKKHTISVYTLDDLGTTTNPFYLFTGNGNGASLSAEALPHRSFHPMAPEPTRWEKFLRWTGTAVGAVRVKDASIRSAQFRLAVRVTAALVLGTIVAMAIILVIP